MCALLRPRMPMKQRLGRYACEHHANVLGLCGLGLSANAGHRTSQYLLREGSTRLKWQALCSPQNLKICMQVCLGALEACSACPCQACPRRTRCTRAFPHLTSATDWGSSIACCLRGLAVIQPQLSRTSLVQLWLSLYRLNRRYSALTQTPFAGLFRHPGIVLPTAVLGAIMLAEPLTALL